MHKNSMKLMKEFKETYLSDLKGGTVLDVGSQMVEGQKSYRQIFEPDFVYTGMDIEAGDNVDIVGYYNIYQVYDVVISGQVMEHIERPWEWLKMLSQYYSRYICIIAPCSWKQHRYPIDTYRYYPDGMRALFEYAGIPEVKIWKDTNDTIGIGGKR